MTRRERLDRRRFLRAVGGGAAALPFYRALERSAAGAASHPLRLITLFSPNGTWPAYWRPQGGERDFNLRFDNSVLEPLEPFRSKILILDGIDFKVNYEKDQPRVSGHEIGPATVFTAVPCGGRHDEPAVPRGPSIDNFLAERLGGSTPLRSLRLAVGHDRSVSYSAAGKVLLSVDRPSAAYKLIFGQTAIAPGDPAAAADAARRATDRRLGVLGALRAEIDRLRLRPRLAAPERQKLDEHLGALADIERRIRAQASTAAAGTCERPAPRPDPTSRSGPENTRMQMDLLAQALACDVTRFAHLCIHGSGWGDMPWLGYTNIHNVVAHRVGTANPAANLDLAKIHRYYAGEVAYLLAKLDSIREGDGTLLDHTIIVWATEFGNPAAHDGRNVPFVMAGGGNGQLRMGRYLSYENLPTSPTNKYAHYMPHNAVYVTVCQAFGLQTDTFGDPDYKGGLPGVLA